MLAMHAPQVKAFDPTGWYSFSFIFIIIILIILILYDSLLLIFMFYNLGGYLKSMMVFEQFGIQCKEMCTLVSEMFYHYLIMS